MKSIALISGFLLCPVAFAYQGYGVCNYGKENLQSVVCYGPTMLKESQVTGDIKVTGPLRAYHVVAGGVSVTGPVLIENSAIHGLVNVIGDFSAVKDDFASDLNITSQVVTLNQSTVHGSITIHASEGEPRLKLQCSTAVAGSVTFSDKPGVVEVTEDSIVQGKVINGEIAFVKLTCPN